jgi:hypothetical protein
MKISGIACFIYFTLFSFTLSSQQLKDYQVGLALRFDNSDLKKLEKAVEEVKEGLIMADEAKAFYEALSDEEKNRWKSPGHKKAIKLLGEASETMRNAHNDMYAIYVEYTEQFWETQKEDGHYAAGMNKARYYERIAARNYKTANLRRDQVLTSDNFQRAVNKNNQAYDMEMLTMRDKGRSLNIYQDFPVEYDYGWDNDVSDETVANFFANKYVVEPDENRVDTIVIAQVDTVYLEKESQTEAEVAQDEKWLPDVQFKVQIAAHVKPITNAEILNLYTGEERVDVVFEDNWYKYQIGPYDRYSQAKRVLDGADIGKAFIVPYRDGKKITIKEALKNPDEE